MIKHIKCDIFESGADIICHQVNCQGVMGSGIAKQVREKFPWVYGQYKKMCEEYKDNPKMLLGITYPVKTWDIYHTSFGGIVNLFAQENFGYDGKCYTDYSALRECLDELKCRVSDGTLKGAKIAFPYLMGCHRGGGDWNIVYKMIEEVFADSDCEVLICEYNGG